MPGEERIIGIMSSWSAAPDNVNQGLPYEYALETMRINGLS